MTQTPTDALRLVPVEPTEAMVDVGKNSILEARAYSANDRESARAIWAQMLAAAPASPLPGGGDWGAIRNAFVRHADAFVKASRYEEASAIADKAAREIQDLMSPLPAAPTGDARNGRGEG